MANMTKLEAVNRILRGAREHPVSSLGDPLINDVLMAEQLLDEVTRREQMTSIHVNTTEQELTPDSNNQVLLPDTVLQVLASKQHVKRNFGLREENGVTKLIDIEENRDTFPDDTSVFVRVTAQLAFEDLPIQHQFSIADQSAVEYQITTLGSNTLDRSLQARAARSRAIARAYDMRTRPNNQFDNGRSNGPREGARFTPRRWGN